MSKNKRDASRRLLVEGEADRGFFESLLSYAKLDSKSIWVGPPTDFDAAGS
jgi:hypothetical protein